MDVAELRALAGKFRTARGNGDPDKYLAAVTVTEAHIASAGILALIDERDRLRRALAWIDNVDPEIVSAAEKKFGFKLFSGSGDAT